MSYITVAGDVSDPTGLAEPNCLIKFVADVSYNKTLKNSVSIIPVASDGSYTTQLSKGAFMVGIDYSGKGSFSPIGRIVIDDNTASVITLSDLLNDGKVTSSLSTSELDRLSNSVRSAIESENAAATSATSAQARATASANSAEDSADSATESRNSATKSAASAASAKASQEASANSAKESLYSAADSANSATAAAASEASAMTSACTAATSATRAAEAVEKAIKELTAKVEALEAKVNQGE